MENLEIKNDLEKEVLEKMFAANLKPVAKWRFILKNWMIWSLGVIAVLLGALAFSSILYFFQPGEIEAWGKSGADWKEFLLFSLPYFWLFFLIIFLLTAWYYFRRTEKGHRYSLLVILASSILISVLLGSFTYGAGLAKVIDNFLGREAPFYGDLINPRVKFWLNPEKGRLSGLVTEKKSNEEFVVYNRMLGEWQVKSSAEIGVMAKEGRPIIVIGRRISPNHFQAEEVFIPPSGGEFFRRGGKPPRPERIGGFIIPFNLEK
jgi:hypothetical protein